MKNKERYKKILQDIFLLDPKFKSDKKKLEEILNILLNTKSNIKVSNKFKWKLKTRLNNIIKLKKQKSIIKPNYIQIFWAIFTWLVFVFGFFYIFKDNLFFSPNFSKNIIKKRSISENDFKFSTENNLKEEIKEVKEDKSIFKNEILNVEEKTKTAKDNLIVPSITKNQDENIGNNIESSILKEEINEKDEDVMDYSVLENQWEVDQIQDLEENVENTSISSDYSLDINTRNTTNLNIEKDSFKDYCLNIWWIFNKISDLCILENKSCNRDDYEAWICLKLLEIEDNINIYIEDFIEEYSK